jgi:hypothetical protein
MIAADECIHLLDPATCTLCNGREKREREEAARIVVESHPFRARFDGRCRACFDGFTEGELIVRINDGLYAHKECT